MKKRYLRLVYATSIAVLFAVGGLGAAWPHGCCDDDSSMCGDTKICCTRPNGWAQCYNGWFDDKPDYCNYDDCNLYEQN